LCSALFFSLKRSNTFFEVVKRYDIHHLKSYASPMKVILLHQFSVVLKMKASCKLVLYTSSAEMKYRLDSSTKYLIVMLSYFASFSPGVSNYTVKGITRIKN
jgi:hypothetical protein